MKNRENETLSMLVNSKGKSLVSIYWPLSGRDLKKRFLEFLNFVEQNLRQVGGVNLSQDWLDGFMNDLKRTVELTLNNENKGSIAIFKSQNFTKVLTLPYFVEPKTVVSSSFHIKPLFRMKNYNKTKFYVVVDNKKADLYKLNDVSFQQISTLSNSNFSEEYSSLYDEISSKYHFSLLVNEWVQSEVEESNETVTFVCSQRFKRFFEKLSLGQMKKQYFVEENIKDKSSHGILKKIYENLELEYVNSLRTLLFHIEESSSDGRLIYNLDEIIYEIKNGNVDKLIIPEDKELWGLLDFNKAKIQKNGEQIDVFDDCIYDDLGEIFYSMGGEVQTLPSALFPNDTGVCAILKGYQVSFEQKTYFNFAH